MIDRCRVPPTVQAKDAETAVVWEVPQFSDNSGRPGRRSVNGGPVDGLLVCSSVLLMIVKQDLFHWKKEGLEACVCVCRL